MKPSTLKTSNIEEKENVDENKITSSYMIFENETLNLFLFNFTK